MLATVLSSANTAPAHALFGVGDIVFDPAQFSKQVIQLATEIVTKGATLATQVNTWNTTYKLTILDPLANAMIAVTLIKQQSDTINLVTGSLGGGNPLLKDNPEQWIKNQGLSVVRISLGDLSQQQGPYTDSLFKSAVDAFKPMNISLQTTLSNINSSSVPTTVQKSLCADAQLTEVARNDVMKSDGTFDQTELATRKREIYNSLCIGNPSSNPQLAQKLTQVGTQRPDIAGWDTWLAVTSGENEYNKSVRGILAIDASVEERRKQKEAELNRGGGLASPSKCTETAQFAPNGDPFANIADAACRMQSLTNTGGAVNSAFQSAINAPMERLINSFGSGILSTLSTLLSARNTLGMLSNAFSNTAAGGGNPNSDLANNQENKSSLTNPILRRLSTYSSSLTKLEEANAGIRTEIITTQNIAQEIVGCYEALMEDFGINEQYPGVSGALSYSSNRKQIATRLSNSLQSDSFAIAAARSFISDMEARMAASNSSGEINDLFSSFEAKVADEIFPSDSAGSLRQAEYQTLKGENQVEVMEGGDAYQFRAQCATIRQQLTPREQA